MKRPSSSIITGFSSLEKASNAFRFAISPIEFDWISSNVVLNKLISSPRFDSIL